MMTMNKTIWEPNSPDSLFEIAISSVLSQPQVLVHAKNYGGSIAELRSEEDVLYSRVLDLPFEVAERLLATLCRQSPENLSDSFCHLFETFSSITASFGLKRVTLKNSQVSDDGLSCLLHHQLVELDIHNCQQLTRNSLENINKFSDSLITLNIGNSNQILPVYISCKNEKLEADDDIEDFEDDDDEEQPYYERDYILRAPMLQRLCIRNLFVRKGVSYLLLLLKPLKKLTHLDLSGLYLSSSDTDGLRGLLCLEHIVSLSLHNVNGIESSLFVLAELKTLRHLDISQRELENGGHYHIPDEQLNFLTVNLPELTSLDISGTNLAGNPPAATDAANLDPENPRCEILGLSSRMKNPLEFLGLYKTDFEACWRNNIPATWIAGDSSEIQILTAARHYMDLPVWLESILNDIYKLFRFDLCVNKKAALDAILMAMDRHPHEKAVQISGSASLYYVVKSELKGEFNVRIKRKILTCIFNAMLTHKQDAVMMRNGCLTLCQFNMPQDILFDYERLVNILLYIVSEHSSVENGFVQRAGIFLLNSLAFQVDGQQKLLVGNLGAMEKMLSLIAQRVNVGLCDDVMETAWSTMWNVTDETPVNCKRFLDGSGMDLFLRCKEEFPDRQALLRNMMGLLGNVAEVVELRHKLMTKEFVCEFSMLLDSNSDGIELSYSAAGVLAHMASDGVEAWSIEDPSRGEVLCRMENAIDRWNIDSKRNINYRSIEPILRLVMVFHTPQCQHWALWALANLTKIDSKYCSLVEQEGGLPLLDLVMCSYATSNSYHQVPCLAKIVKYNVIHWQEENLRQQEESMLSLLPFDDDN